MFPRIPYDRVSCHTIHSVNREEKIFRSLVFFSPTSSSSDRRKVAKGKGLSVIVRCDAWFDISFLRKRRDTSLDIHVADIICSKDVRMIHIHMSMFCCDGMSLWTLLSFSAFRFRRYFCFRY